MPYPTTFYQPAQTVNERSRARYTCQLTTETGARVPLASLATVRLWLYEIESGDETIINNVSNLDILNANRGTIVDDGVTTTLTITFVPADTALVVATRAIEARRALIKWTWGVDGEAYHEFEWAVRNLSKVP
jgi:hypothetical protein